MSSKKSEAIIAQRKQSEPYDSEHPPTSLFDKTIVLRSEAWVISIVRKKIWSNEKNDPRQHAFLILESVEDGLYCIRRIDFVLEQRHHYLPQEVDSGTKVRVFGQGLIEIADKSLFDMESLVPQCCARSQGILPEQGRQLLENIRIAQSQRLGYCLTGAGNMYKMFRMKEAIKHHNCLSWCEEQLQNIGVQLTEERWIDGLLNNPSRKLKDEEPTSGSKCILM